ncbi:MAG TPA: hypothetical protein VFB58_13035 [Chloroflexota bacterium]|nr:hypothetical protein [Chloroflexota bacterium]
MERYDVLVHNDETGESVVVPIDCDCSQEAQTQALIRLFHERGWRKASAPVPSPACAAERRTA